MSIVNVMSYTCSYSSNLYTCVNLRGNDIMHNLKITLRSVGLNVIEKGLTFEDRNILKCPKSFWGHKKCTKKKDDLKPYSIIYKKKGFANIKYFLGSQNLLLIN